MSLNPIEIVTQSKIKNRKSKIMLTDSFGREHTNLRISVTDRCNIRCFYCMPAENVQFMDRKDLLTFEEMERFTDRKSVV